MPSQKLEDLHPDLQPVCHEFLRRCAEAGLDILITCTWRSGAEQDALYAQGRTRPGARVTNARAGQSAHNHTIAGKPASRAFDIVPLQHGKAMWNAAFPAWSIAGQIGESLGLVWYGNPKARFHEMPHFELARGYQ